MNWQQQRYGINVNHNAIEKAGAPAAVRRGRGCRKITGGCAVEDAATKDAEKLEQEKNNKSNKGGMLSEVRRLQNEIAPIKGDYVVVVNTLDISICLTYADILIEDIDGIISQEIEKNYLMKSSRHGAVIQIHRKLINPYTFSIEKKSQIHITGFIFASFIRSDLPGSFVWIESGKTEIAHTNNRVSLMINDIKSRIHLHEEQSKSDTVQGSGIIKQNNSGVHKAGAPQDRKRNQRNQGRDGGRNRAGGMRPLKQTSEKQLLEYSTKEIQQHTSGSAALGNGGTLFYVNKIGILSNPNQSIGQKNQVIIKLTHISMINPSYVYSEKKLPYQTI